jgi:hypothetical protein
MVRNCTRSLEKTRSSVQSSATRCFFSNLGRWSVTTTRQGIRRSFRPGILATPVLRPFAASCPMAANENFFFAPSRTYVDEPESGPRATRAAVQKMLFNFPAERGPNLRIDTV